MPRNRRSPAGLIAAVAILALLVGCAGQSEESGEVVDDRPWVVATTDIVGDVVARVAADRVNLSVLLPPGGDPHGYEPTARVVAELGAARLIFVNGFGLEENLLELLEEVSSSPLVSVSEGIVPRENIADHEAAGEAGNADDHHADEEPDPHTWMSPVNVRTWVRNIVSALSAMDPGSASIYAESARTYLAELDALDRLVRETVSQIPPERRRLVTDHRVFGYFADEYGFEQIGFVVASSSTNAEATASELASLVQLIVERNVPAIFVGDTANQRMTQLTQAIAAEAGEEIRVVRLLTGALAPPGEPGDTYLGFIQYNVAQLAAALGAEQGGEF